MRDMVITFGVWIALGIGAWLGSRGLDRAFHLFGEYGAGPSPYPARRTEPTRR